MKFIAIVAVTAFIASFVLSQHETAHQPPSLKTLAHVDLNR